MLGKQFYGEVVCRSIGFDEWIGLKSFGVLDSLRPITEAAEEFDPDLAGDCPSLRKPTPIIWPISASSA
jgi:hypothetical protein